MQLIGAQNTEWILEQSTARIKNTDHRPHPFLTWQDLMSWTPSTVNLLTFFQGAMSPHHLSMLQLIKNEILAEADEDTFLTSDLKTGILMRLELKYDKKNSCGHIDWSSVGLIFPKQIWVALNAKLSLLNGKCMKLERRREAEGGEPAHPPPAERKTLRLFDCQVKSSQHSQNLQDRVAREMVIYKQEALIDRETVALGWWRINKSCFPFSSNETHK